MGQIIFNTETVGALDLGGASTQLAMEIRNSHQNVSGLLSQSNNLWREYNVNDLMLYGRNYSVYSHSSLCYGVFEVIKRYESMLIVQAETTGTNVVDSPCQPLGYTQVVKADRVFNTPCSQNRSTSVEQWTLNGTSDYLQCSSLIERLFNLTYCQSHFLPQTCFSDEGQPSLESQDFMAFSTFKILTRDLNITNNSSLTDFRHAVQSVCNMTIDQAMNIPGSISLPIFLNSSF